MEESNDPLIFWEKKLVVQEKHVTFRTQNILIFNNIPGHFSLILEVCMAHLYKEVLHLHLFI